MDALGIVAAVIRYGDPVANVDSLNDQDPFLGLDLAYDFNVIGLRVDFDLTRLQRAGKGARQSPASRCNDVIERRRVRRKLVGLNAVMFGDFGVHSEGDGLLLGGQIGKSLRATEAFYLHARDVRDLGHLVTLPPVLIMRAGGAIEPSDRCAPRRIAGDRDLRLPTRAVECPPTKVVPGPIRAHRAG
jgi:hypothetical protein